MTLVKHLKDYIELIANDLPFIILTFIEPT